MKPVKPKPWTTVALVLMNALTGMTIGACQPSSDDYVAPPPPTVTVSQPVQRDVTDYLEFTGNAQAVQLVEIRARVRGFLERVHFEAATDVQKGDLLYVIDPRPFQAQFNKAIADVANGQSSHWPRQTIGASRRCINQKARPKAEFVKAKADCTWDKRNVAAARAVLGRSQAEISGYTKIRAPISGRIGRNLVSVGNLVGASENTLLTTLVQYDPIWSISV